MRLLEAGEGVVSVSAAFASKRVKKRVLLTVTVDSRAVAGLVVGDVLDALPRPPWVVVGEAVLSLPLVGCFSIPDAGPEGGVTVFWLGFTWMCLSTVTAAEKKLLQTRS